MNFPFQLYVLDTETTGLSQKDGCEIIELSICRINDGVQKTWCMRPKNYEAIQPEALRINGHKLEDLKWATAYGRETYREVSKVLPDVEAFFMEDCESPDNRVLIGQNVGFDLEFLQAMWKAEGVADAFPFGLRPKMIDTMQLMIFLDVLDNKKEQYYNLGSLIKRYGVKNAKAHSASADTTATKELFLAILKDLKNKTKNASDLQ